MSSDLVLASVTALLKNLLENGLTEHHISDRIGSTAPVTVLPPDRIATGADEQPQLNLFLFQIVPNTVRRRPGGTAHIDGHPTIDRPFLAIDLHYLVTAYGAADFQIEILLGLALRLLQRESDLQPRKIDEALKSLSSDRDGRGTPPTAAALARSNLASQVKELKIIPQFLAWEEMSKIWSALQARYRPSVVYKVSLVVIDS
jgi:hypothetical protein